MLPCGETMYNLFKKKNQDDDGEAPQNGLFLCIVNPGGEKKPQQQQQGKFTEGKIIQLVDLWRRFEVSQNKKKSLRRDSKLLKIGFLKKNQKSVK